MTCTIVYYPIWLLRSYEKARYEKVCFILSSCYIARSNIKAKVYLITLKIYSKLSIKYNYLDADAKPALN